MTAYEAVMCQVDRFFLLLTSLARYILGDDDNASVRCIKASNRIQCYSEKDSRLNTKLFDESEIMRIEEIEISRLDSKRNIV